MRKISIIGAIDEESYKAFCERLDQLEAESKKPIDIELCSGGGDSYIAFAFATRMRLSTCKLIVTIYGQCQSAAVALLFNANKVRISKEAWIMIHQDTTSGDSETTHDALVNARQMRRMEDWWNDQLEEKTARPWEDWEKLHRDTTYFNAEEAVTIGLADEII